MNAKLILMAVTAATLTGCATTGTAEPEGEKPAASAACDNAGLERFVGMKATAQLGGEAKRLSGAKTLRWVPPRTAVTMDFREDRLTVSYDDDMIVISARCG